MYHIGVGFEVVRFDKMGLPGPQFVKRATGKFTLTFLFWRSKDNHLISSEGDVAR